MQEIILGDGDRGAEKKNKCKWNEEWNYDRGNRFKAPGPALYCIFEELMFGSILPGPRALLDPVHTSSHTVGRLWIGRICPPNTSFLRCVPNRFGSPRSKSKAKGFKISEWFLFLLHLRFKNQTDLSATAVDSANDSCDLGPRWRLRCIGTFSSF